MKTYTGSAAIPCLKADIPAFEKDSGDTPLDWYVKHCPDGFTVDQRKNGLYFMVTYPVPVIETEQDFAELVADHGPLTEAGITDKGKTTQGKGLTGAITAGVSLWLGEMLLADIKRTTGPKAGLALFAKIMKTLDAEETAFANGWLNAIMAENRLMVAMTQVGNTGVLPPEAILVK